MLRVSSRLLTPALTRACACGVAPKTIGLGYTSPELAGVSRASLIKAMMSKIDQPGRFLPVSSVSVQAASGAAAEEGALWRSMVFDGAGTSVQIVEHIYANPSSGEIRFVAVEGSGHTWSEGSLEVVNVLHTKPLRIEYYQRHRHTGERIDWLAPLQSVVGAIEATHALAQAAETLAADASDFGSKA